MATRVRRHHTDEEESYFISMTDLVIGLLFIFIIMLMFFALQFKDAREETKEINSEFTQEINHLRNAEEVRRRILQDIERLLRDRGIEVSIIWEQGILRLPESVLFEKGSAELNEKGQGAIEALADALESILPCYTRGRLSTRLDCPAETAIIEAIFIEGHTDNDPLSPRSGMRDNLDLSAMRATNTYRTLLQASSRLGDVPKLHAFENAQGAPVLSVSGYGEHRPAEPLQLTEKQKAINRRIDLRILMTTPKSEEIEGIQVKLNVQQDGSSP